jgi:hypothetical protein
MSTLEGEPKEEVQSTTFSAKTWSLEEGVALYVSGLLAIPNRPRFIAATKTALFLCSPTQVLSRYTLSAKHSGHVVGYHEGRFVIFP